MICVMNCVTLILFCLAWLFIQLDIKSVQKGDFKDVYCVLVIACFVAAICSSVFTFGLAVDKLLIIFRSM